MSSHRTPAEDLLLAADLLLTPGQVAALFGVGRRTIERWANNGRIPTAHYTLGGQRRYRTADITPILAAAKTRTRPIEPGVSALVEQL